MNIKFLTFYYDYDGSKYYENCAMNLKSQLESFEKTLIIDTPQLGPSYNLNCLYKPKIILETLEKIKSPLVWIDADCFVRENPTEFDDINNTYKNIDIGVIIRENEQLAQSAVIYFNYTKNTIKFLNDWIKECSKHIENNYFNGGDHGIFIDLLKKHDLNKIIFTPQIASRLYENSKLQIRISNGGWETESKKELKYLTFLNSGCIDICKNMLQSAKNVGINDDNFIIACLDENAYNNFKNYKNCFLWCNQDIKDYQNWTFDKNSGFRNIVKMKWQIIKTVYEKYQRLCWIDTDIVFKKNPEEQLKNDEKILFQCDKPGSWICSGFMVFNHSIECQKLIEECAHNNDEDDQLIVNNLALTKYSDNIALLDIEQFPNGHIYYNLGKKEKAFIVHNNHMIGIETKINKFKEENLWFI